MFAGPNGSGKSTLKRMIDERLLGCYLNADDIEKHLGDRGAIDLSDFGLRSSAAQAVAYLRRSRFLQGASGALDQGALEAEGSVLRVGADASNSYFASVLVEFLRRELMAARQSFTFETVMSHPSKIDALVSARDLGYRTYLYFVGTEDASINVTRVAERVRRGGHPVPEDKIRERYERTMGLLKSAVVASHRAYLFDNSGTQASLVAEITDGHEVTVHSAELPRWVLRHLLRPA